MASTALRGNPVNLSGELPKVGDKAPDFSLIKQDMSTTTLGDYAGKVKILVAVPSLDTPVCAKETKEFNQQVAGMTDTVAIVVSGDLPFAQKRYCAAEGVENVVTGSQFRDMNFSKAYGTHMVDGPLQDLSARAVFVVDKEDKISYVELVPDITKEPDYDTILAEAKKLL